MSVLAILLCNRLFYYFTNSKSLQKSLLRVFRKQSWVIGGSVKAEEIGINIWVLTLFKWFGGILMLIRGNVIDQWCNISNVHFYISLLLRIGPTFCRHFVIFSPYLIERQYSLFGTRKQTLQIYTFKQINPWRGRDTWALDQPPTIIQSFTTNEMHWVKRGRHFPQLTFFLPRKVTKGHCYRPVK